MADSASLIGASPVAVISASWVSRQLLSRGQEYAVAVKQFPESGRRASPPAAATDQSRTRTSSAEGPSKIKPPIMTLSPVCTRPRVEMFASSESAVVWMLVSGLEQANTGGVTDAAHNGRVNAGIKPHEERLTPDRYVGAMVLSIISCLLGASIQLSLLSIKIPAPSCNSRDRVRQHVGEGREGPIRAHHHFFRLRR